MSEYREKRTVVQDVPVGSRPVVETRYDSVVDERRGMSGVAVAALVVAAITAAVVITMLITNSQQRNSDEELAQERARTAAAQQMPAQPAQQQPVIVNLPASQPATVAVPYPVASTSQPAPVEARTTPSSASVETDVASRLQNDEELRSYTIDVKVSGATAILRGHVPDEDLKKRAEKLARAVNGVQSVLNDIAVRP
ncbi:MAG TPA: BON domain-containing protein [Blastocatellia bacterium]|nr:BON domain-containing protein [Blastocatellia bacterium]